MEFTTKFGLLPSVASLDVDGICVRPDADYDATVDAIRSQTNPDGYFYPPMSETFRYPNWPDEDGREPVPQTKRPAHLFYMPMTHVLELSGPSVTTEPAEETSFIVQVFAYLFGTRLQLEGWQIDSRVPVTRLTHPVWVSLGALHRFVPRAVDEWRAQPADRRRRLTNVLYLHAKAPSYEWTWEQFLMEYVVLDGLYDYSFRAGLVVGVTHEDRIRELCGRLGVWCPREAPVAELVSMRNTLFHEGLWEGERPGYRISAAAYHRAGDLRHLNQRLIAAMLGGANEYTRSSWERVTQQLFFV